MSVSFDILISVWWLLPWRFEVNYMTQSWVLEMSLWVVEMMEQLASAGRDKEREKSAAIWVRGIHFEKFLEAKLISSNIVTRQWKSTHFPTRVCKLIIMLPTKSANREQNKNINAKIRKMQSRMLNRENLRRNKPQLTLDVSVVPKKSTVEGHSLTTGTSAILISDWIGRETADTGLVGQTCYGLHYHCTKKIWYELFFESYLGVSNLKYLQACFYY